MNRPKAIFASYVGVVLFASLIFVAAGRIAYWQGLLYLGFALAGTTLNHLLVPAGSNITVERLRGAQSGETWDRRLLGALFLVTVVTFVTAGLDSGRFRWSGHVPFSVTLTGAGLMFAGQLLFALAKRENAFFSSTVRIQTERNHRVCDTGVYRCVRHPGYAGLLLSLVAFPLLINSYWSIVPTILAVAVIVARTVLEDRFLFVRLPGYADYTGRTRWRLIPGMF